MNSKRKYMKIWRIKNAAAIKEYQREWILRNREHVNAYQRQRRKLKPVMFRSQNQRKWERLKSDPERMRKRSIRLNARKRHRRQNDIGFRLQGCLQKRMWDALKGRTKGTHSIELLGCSIEDFKIYIESKWQTGMTWENYGEHWEIDHIIPCAIFDLAKPEHQKRCFHFSNLQPLFWKENVRKGGRPVTNQFNLL